MTISKIALLLDVLDEILNNEPEQRIKEMAVKMSQMEATTENLERLKDFINDYYTEDL